MAGNKNDLAYKGIDELETINSVGLTDGVLLYESNIPKKGATVQDIINLSSEDTNVSKVVQVSVTLAELNAGKTLIAAVSGKQIVVTDVNFVMNGSFAA